MIAKRFLCLALVSLCGLGRLHADSANSTDISYPNGLYGWYEAGVAVVDKAKIQDFFGNAVQGNTVEFDPGFHFGIAIGREFTRYFRAEIESGFNYNSLKSIGGATASSGNYYRVPIMANLVLQYPNSSGFIPVIGLGVGAQWATMDAQNISLGNTTLNDSSETWVFGYQGYAGFRYEFRRDMSVGIFYHYNVADSPSWTFSSAGTGNFKLDSVRTHTLSITLGWVF